MATVRLIGAKISPVASDILVVAAEIFSLLRSSGFIAFSSIFGQCTLVLPAVPAIATQITPILVNIAGVMPNIPLVLANVL
jgi:hypothetical protein